MRSCKFVEIENDSQIDEWARKTVPVSFKPKFMKQVLAHHNVRIKKLLSKAKSKKQIPGFKIQKSISLLAQFLSKNHQLIDQNLQKKTIYINGSKIEGTWKNNLLHGYAIIEYQTGQRFQGNYRNGVRIQGMIKFKDGTQYLGGFHQNSFHGLGTLIDTSKRRITCKWNKGKPEQKVKIEYPSQDVYYGEIKQMQKHGQGYLFFKNGNKYVGEFYEGEITGQGTYYENDIKLMEGQWKNGLLLSKSSKVRFSIEVYKTAKFIKQQSPINQYQSQCQNQNQNLPQQLSKLSQSSSINQHSQLQQQH